MIDHAKPDLTETQHFLPNKSDMPDLATEVKILLDKTPIMGVGLPKFDPENPPFRVAATSWHWLNEWGPLQREAFLGHLQGAIESFAALLNGRDYEDGALHFYPIHTQPEPAYGFAFHDFGFSRESELNVRFVMTYGPVDDGEEIIGYGLKFHVTTLVKTLPDEPFGG